MMDEVKLSNDEGEPPVELDEPYHPQHDLCGPRRRIIYGGVGLVAVILIIIISVSVSKNKQSQPMYATVQSEDQSLFEEIKGASKGRNITTDDLLLVDGYQYKAFKWLSDNRDIAKFDRTQTLQRYALACLYYSTYMIPTEYTPEPQPWNNDNLWMTNEPECLWAGIECDSSSDKVTSIILEKNNMSGKLPPELAFIRDPLHTLDLTSNRIYMKEDEMEVFGQLSHLQVLNIDDNFFTTSNGLPRSFEALTKLKQFKASYNLMAGKLDNGVLNNMQKLTHLEIESNFVTGALHFLGEMPELIYVYLRRNELNDAHLHFMKGGTLTNLFSIWLDGNKITEFIPTQIGKLTNLASMSIANCSLTGSIPTEMGGLPKLNRIWLYGNKLTGTVPKEIANLTGLQVFEVQRNDLKGTMPSGVCSLIKDSDYDQKSLAADCSEVTCENCCTKCNR